MDIKIQQPVSEINTSITIEYLCDKDENQYFEKKGIERKLIKPVKIAEELIGMLNADGGVLAFGVSDDGELQDLNAISDKLDKYRSLVFDFIQPSSNIKLEEVIVDNKLIFLYHVEPEIERVFSTKENEKVFLRVIDTNRLLNREQVKKLEYDKQIRKFEEDLVKDFDVTDLDTNLLQQYKEKINYKGSELDLLVKRHIANYKQGDYQIKNAAVLLFAKDPEKYIPSASVRYIKYDGTIAQTGTKHNVIKDERFESNVPTLINELRLFLQTSFKDYYFLDINTGRFKKVPEYPEEAWLEGVVNALCHRSYNIQGNAIYIKHFDDRLEISNSGPLPAQVTVENIKTERYARNPRLARILEDMGYVRQLNEGVSRIYESMEKSMLSVPEYKVTNGNIYLTLRNKVSDHTESIDSTIFEKIENTWNEYNETEKKILGFLFKNFQGMIIDFSNYTGVNEKSIKKYLNKFVKQNIMDRISEKQRDKNAIYILKKHANTN